jgi:hypothetical protein
MPSRPARSRRTWITATLRVLLLSPFLLAPIPAGADQDEDSSARTRRLVATRINPKPPRVDGRLEDDVWKKAHFTSGFVQKEPNEGEPARDSTQVAVVYDDRAVYVGARMFSSDPDGILSTVSRRDNVTNSERILISLDTYRNRRTAVTFGVTASGVRVDYYHPSDYEYQRDYEFDPVWTADAAPAPGGWTAEMRIPFSQLRFRNEPVQVWGVNLNRWVPTLNEDSYWVLVSKDDTGWASRMGELVGIEGVEPSRRLELLPYAASDATLESGVDPADPFRDGEDYNARMGGDLKMGLGPNLTLEATVNPDFGQVEADPAEVNLSAYETFFSERRPFFTEGSQLLSGGGAGYFYSRRIGAPPHGEAEGDFVNVPDNTTILGAGKLTGRLNSGLSVGALGAVSAHEKADVFDDATGITRKVDVEPATGYGVLRLQQEVDDKGSTAGLILTGVQRDLDPGDDLDQILDRRAFAGGGDWRLRFDDGKYELDGNVGFSYVEGSRQAIENVQTSSTHYYQRPDADHVDFDTTRTSLGGWIADIELEKLTGEHWLWGGGVGAESPGFEINDAGQLNSADDIESWAGLRYRENERGRIFHNYQLAMWLGSGWNFGGDRQYSFLDVETNWTWKNFMSTFVGFEAFPRSQSDDLTRGGPSMGTFASWNVAAGMNSSNQNKTTWSTFGVYAENEDGAWEYYLEGALTFRPGDRWEFSLTPVYDRELSHRQYVDTIEGGGAGTFGKRYVFSFIERSQLVSRLRLNYAFTPDLSLELYAEPFTASGRYFDFGELEAARSRDLRTYGSDGTTITENADGTRTVTDGGDTFTIDDLDFNVVSFRSNLVLRWEWSPGSTLYLVWQQNRAESTSEGRLVRPSGLWDSISAEGDNYLAVKVSYWIPVL